MAATAQQMRSTAARMMPDQVPGIRAAGKTIALGGEGSDYCIRQDVHGASNGYQPSTPDHLKKYRKSFQNQPGLKQIHPGMANDQPKVGEGHAFGKKTYNSDHVHGVIKAQNLAGLADKFNDIKENKYASKMKEPLGVGFQRGYNWPDRAQQNQFSFGVGTIGSENAKQVMYPYGGDKEEKQEIARMYNKTHGNFAPGEQRNREYNWSVDKGQHRFGYGEQKLLNGAAMSIHNERFESSFPKTVIVKKTVEDQKAVTQDQLGKTKNMGQGKPPKPEDHAYGVKNLVGGEVWNVGKCLHGEPTEKELGPDKDLGKSVKPGCRNTVRKDEDWKRSFGAPTIRTDIPYKEKRSIADYNNYGDEPEAVDLLFPSTFNELGISEYDFQVMRPRDEIKQLFERIGYSYKIGKFNAMYNRAKELCNSAEDSVSVRAFMQAVQEMHYIE